MHNFLSKSEKKQNKLTGRDKKIKKQSDKFKKHYGSFKKNITLKSERRITNKEFQKELNKNVTDVKKTLMSMSKIDSKKRIRIGGMVKKGSLNISSKEIRFTVTDFKNELVVSYSGTIPNLFSEGKGVVAEGVLQDKKFFIADRILAKHDENYMPPELRDIMKKDVK